MDLVSESFSRLFPKKEFSYQTKIEHNRRLKDFNANIRLKENKICLHLNLKWKSIDDEIKIGLIQSLLLKLFKVRKSSANTELYHNFIKKLPELAQKTPADPFLAASFHRVNQKYFTGLLKKPNLRWGEPAFRKLASYNFHDDGVTISSLFQKAREEVLDYLMHHELLHKHHQFQCRRGRNSFHDQNFRAAEKSYPHRREIEEEIKNILFRSQRKRGFLFWQKKLPR